MPMTAAFIDSLREVFGREGIDRSIRRGMKGEADWFHAREAGHEVGAAFSMRGVPATRPPEPGR